MFIHDIGLNIFSDPPRVKLNLGSGIDRNQISEGQDVYMDCEIRANPRFYKVEWIHNVSSISNIHQIENMSLFKYNGIAEKKTLFLSCTIFSTIKNKKNISNRRYHNKSNIRLIFYFQKVLSRFCSIGFLGYLLLAFFQLLLRSIIISDIYTQIGTKIQYSKSDRLTWDFVCDRDRYKTNREREIWLYRTCQ